MSSILTNNSAMVALQTLRGINRNLDKTQQEISTGKTIASAKDGAAVWSISKVMESDVTGFQSISDSLNLGASTIAVARVAAERVTDLLGEVKKSIIASQEKNVDRTKVQDDITALTKQIGSIVGAAQFNGLNLLQMGAQAATVAEIVGNTGAGAGVLGGGTLSILSSLDRSSGGISASNIDVARADLSTRDAVVGTTNTGIAATAVSGPTTAAMAAAGTGTFTIAGDTTTAARGGNAVLAGDSYKISGGGFGSNDVIYVAKDGDTTADVAKGLFEAGKLVIAENGLSGSVGWTHTEGTSTVGITNTSAAAYSSLFTATATTGGVSAGGLNSLAKMDVTTDDGAAAALAQIEGLTQTAIKTAAEFGTAEKRISIQSDFVKSLMNSLKSGISSLVEADMEETSARLQAGQVQQQLGVQALQIANQAPQNILALFR